jgi:pullulanase/glycogen debranching enzyme
LGENNIDGSNKNKSWNSAWRGRQDKDIEALRNRQVKNFYTVTLLSLGVPMLLMGDEVRRTQHGNNNAYGQDNAASWFDWRRVNKHADVLRFVSMLINARLQKDIAFEDPGVTLNELLRQSRVQWHGVVLNQPDWSDESHSIAMTAWSLRGRFAIHVIANAYWDDLEFELPYLSDVSFRGWAGGSYFFASPRYHRYYRAPKVSGKDYKAHHVSIISRRRQESVDFLGQLLHLVFILEKVTCPCLNSRTLVNTVFRYT